MEINELKYFLYVAKTENVNKASEIASISAGSLSKAIARLESELGVNLFNRVGRNIRLSETGKSLQKRAASILGELEDIKLSISGSQNELNISISGEDLLLSKFGVEFGTKLLTKFPGANLNFISSDNKTSIEKLKSREANIIFTTEKPTQTFDSKIISKVKFQTCISKQHPLYERYKKEKDINVHNLIQYPFVLPSQNLLGRTKDSQSSDGWRDDKFPRKISFKASSIKVLEMLVISGQAIAYLPDYLVKTLEVETLNVSGCPYYCEQVVYQVTRDSNEFGWLNQVW